MDGVHGPVYRYLQLRGYALQPAYFQGTAINWDGSLARRFTA